MPQVLNLPVFITVLTLNWLVAIGVQMVYALVATTLLSQVAIALGIVTYGVMHIILLIRAKRNRALSNFRLAILNAVMDLGKSTKQFVGFVILLRLILLPVAAYLENPRAHLACHKLTALPQVAPPVGVIGVILVSMVDLACLYLPL